MPKTKGENPDKMFQQKQGHKNALYIYILGMSSHIFNFIFKIEKIPMNESPN